MPPKPDYAEIARLERELGLTDEQIIERGREARRKPRELTAAEATERLELARDGSTGSAALVALQGKKVERLTDEILAWDLVMHPGFSWPVEHHDDIRFLGS